MNHMRRLILIAVATAVVLAGSASASNATAPRLVATVQKAVAHKPYPRAGALITIAFTVHEPGGVPDSGVPTGSVFNVELIRRKGLPTGMTAATELNGQYRATIRWSGGLIGRIRIGGFLNGVPSTAQGGFWLPVTVLKKNF